MEEEEQQEEEEVVVDMKVVLVTEKKYSDYNIKEVRALQINCVVSG